MAAATIDDAHPVEIADNGLVKSPAASPVIMQASLPVGASSKERVGLLTMKDGSQFSGLSFGANRSVSGECVFQTGMVGYVESLTDPSYRGQILVLTFPLIGNYGVPDVTAQLDNLPLYVESSQIHVAGLVVARYSEDFSHYLAKSSLSKWLIDQNIPALYGIDTRLLTKKLREEGSMLGKMQFVTDEQQQNCMDLVASGQDWQSLLHPVEWYDPNGVDLVSQVTAANVQIYKSIDQLNAVKCKNGKILRIMAVDVGMKYNQIRCFIKRGVDVTVVPSGYDFTQYEEYDGLFISNGPGDPKSQVAVISKLSQVLKDAQRPVFGICLGHQLLALASGASTIKMKFGNRGQNIPCMDLQSGKCYITSQNHGYAVDVSSLQAGWREWFVNANDGSNEGIMHDTLPFSSVQFHPESSPGPKDTEYLFDRFIETVKRCSDAGRLIPITMPAQEKYCKPSRVDVKKVLILGSGGLSIGQAGEFDYSGSQAIKALKEEGIYTVLINPNIATIQTSKGLADKVYFLPVKPEYVRKVIEYEKPDGIYVSFGGQTALNCGIQMKDEFEQLNVRVLGTPIETVIMTEDRELFAAKMAEINEKCAESSSAINVKEAVDAANRIGYPLIVRAAFALGGLGSGFAYNEKDLRELCTKAFAVSPQVLIERSMKGWKEIEYEVVRDINDNCITVCNMENFDPLGIHTGDSIVVAPSQTLSDEDYNMLRSTAVNVIRHLGVVGECNIQYALNPDSKDYCIIEVNARLSRSSALASKATGYPLAFVAAKLGLHIPLNELKNNVTKVTCACFEPSLDYVVVKIPRWDLRKFSRVSTNLGSAMKSVGEVMAIGRNFEETMQKALRSIDYQFIGFTNNDIVDPQQLENELKNPSDKRVFAIAQAMHSGKYSLDDIWKLTRIDKWFLGKLQNIVNLDKAIQAYKSQTLPLQLLKQAKQLGFSDRHVAKLTGSSEMAIRKIRIDANYQPYVKQIDTVAAESPAFTNYLYTSYNASEHDISFGDNGIIIVGSGVYRIGSSVEFDWCAVRTVRTLRQCGLKTIMINYNPETVSTDYDEADRLYFENITLETVLDIYQLESSSGVIVSMGGQTPNNLALLLHRENVKIYGTSPEQIDGAENRYKFSRMCDTIGVDQPQWKELTSLDEAAVFCDKVGFPVLVRPSYVLSGAAMNVVYSSEDLQNYLLQAVAVSQEYPVVISKFIEEAKEIEMDAVAKDGELIYHVICEHVENAGVHSGDATLVLPPQDLEAETVRKIEIATKKIGYALNVTGPFNIQFIAKNNEIKVIECNVRASRSFPFVSKVLGVDMIELATKAMMNIPFEPYPDSPMPKKDYVCVKVPQFSFGRLSGADPVLGVEMASTGEVACFGFDKYDAYLKALISTGFTVPKKNILLSIGSYKEKLEFLPSVVKLHKLGFAIYATAGTADFISEHSIPVKVLEVYESDADQKAEYSLNQHLSNNMIDLYINLPSRNKYRRPANYMSKGYRTRRMAIDLSIPLITNVKCAKLFVEAMVRHKSYVVSTVDFQTSHHVVSLPGFVDVARYLEPNTEIEQALSESVASGFTFSILFDQAAHSPASINVVADYAMCRPIEVDGNQTLAGELQYLDLCKSHFEVNKLSSLMEKATGLLIVRASGQQLATLLYLSTLHLVKLHITGVYKAEDISLIALSKKHGSSVTCDVHALNFLFSCEIIDGSGEILGSRSDLEALWHNVDAIDCFSSGDVFQRLRNANIESKFTVQDCLPILLKAVKDGHLTMSDLEQRLVTNPNRIFGIPVQANTAIEVEIDRIVVKAPKHELPGQVCRVQLRGESVYVDGNVVVGATHGKLVDLNSSIVDPFINTQRVRKISKTVFTAAVDRKSENLVQVTETTELEPISEGIKRLLPDVPEQSLRVQNRSPSVFSKLRDGSVVPDAVFIGQHNFRKQHIVTVMQFSRAELHMLFNVAHEMHTVVERHGTTNLLAGKVLCNLFLEPSTRTSASFETAMLRLGGQVININDTQSSVKKGESLSDTIRTVGCYADAVVLRHPDVGSAAIAAKVSKVPILNAGDGSGEHPTQALLDIYTIREELGTVNGVTITIVGDLKNGRTVHSLVKLLALYDVHINYVAPESLQMPSHLVQELKKRGLRQQQYQDLSVELIARTDVLYVTRIQKERFTSLAEYEKVKNSYLINNAVLANAKQNMIVLHPLPRVNEIDTEVDFDQRAAYFRQMKYGLYVRMALLALVLGK